MRLQTIIITMALCAAAFAEEQPKAYPSIPKQFIESIYRIRVTNLTHGGLGSGVGVDLSSMGLKDHKYILTCAHVITGKDNKEKVDKIDAIIDIEIIKDKVLHWATGYVVALDTAKDLCLLKVDIDLPAVATLAEKDDLDVGDALLLVGFPNGTAITPEFGYLTAKHLDLLLTDGFYSDRFWQASMPVVGGDSGGAIFDPNRKTLVGIAQACLLIAIDPAAPRGLRPTGYAAPNICYYVPLSSIKSFMDDVAKARKKEAEKKEKDKEKKDSALEGAGAPNHP